MGSIRTYLFLRPVLFLCRNQFLRESVFRSLVVSRPLKSVSRFLGLETKVNSFLRHAIDRGACLGGYVVLGSIERGLLLHAVPINVGFQVV